MIDETSRKLIERAAAHLKSRAPAATAAQIAAAVPQPAPQTVYPQAGYPETAYQQPAYEPAVPQQPVYRQPAPPQPADQQPAYAPSPRTYQAPYPPHQAPYPQAAYEQAPHAAVVNGAAAAYHAPNYQAGHIVQGYARAAPQPTMNGYARDVEGPSMAPPSQGYSRQVSIDRGSLARCGIAVPSAQRSRVVEEFRIVKRQIVAKYVDEPDDEAANRNRVIMVTSTRPREGKTFTAINLALAIATEQDLKVLLIDLDTKHHAMQEMMGIPASYGLTDLLANPDTDFSEVVLRTNLPNLTVIPAGSPNIRSPELLSSRRTRAIFSEMTQRYNDRFIVFDAPAVLASSDPAILAGLVGQIVLVVEADHTQQEELETAIGLLSACPNISLLLNKVRTSAADQFGAYSDY
ncbi:MAG: AAA family ATPase [Alphaproteobacteria bacterium]|nr:AAA family ATPase [Alphaproteobacteria bacterium]